MKKLFAALLLIGAPLFAQESNFLDPKVKMSQASADYPLATLQIRNGLPGFFAKLNGNSAQPVTITIAYLGGSITNHNGYRVYSEEWFKKEYPNREIRTINAGIGGTGSDLGVFRLKDDVLNHKPDLVFVEFAVNDGNGDSAKISNSMEGIVRQIKRLSPATEICFLYTINSPMLKDMEQGRLFKSMRLMEHVADYYHIPSINFGVEVVKLLKEDKLIFKGEKGKSYGEKIVFTDDNTHPTFDQGHRLYNEILTRSIKEIGQTKLKKATPDPKKPLYADNYEHATMFSPEAFVRTGEWKRLEPSNPLYKMNKERCPELIYTESPEASITVKFKGRMIGIYDIVGPSSCGYTAEVDGKNPITVQRFDTYCHYSRNNYSLLPALSEGTHEVTFRLNTKPIAKEEIVSKRFADKITDKVREEYKENKFYVGKIMLVGEVVK